MVKRGFICIPPVNRSANIDEVPEYNQEIEKKYADWIFHK